MCGRHWLENLNWQALGQITHIFGVSVGITKESGLSVVLEGQGDCSSKNLLVFIIRIGEQLVAGSYDHFMIELANRFST
jgi:hypothetical protein